MIQRVGISLSSHELKYIDSLQKQFGVRSRSEFFRELVKRYAKLEAQVNALHQSIQGYLRHPEKHAESDILLRDAMRDVLHEDWQ